MTLTQFDNGYWYATDLKEFAKEIGVRSTSKLRKDELEKTIKHFLKTGKIERPPITTIPTNEVRDMDCGPYTIYSGSRDST